MQFFDVFFDELPKDYNQDDRFAEDGIYAFVEVETGPPANHTFFHAHLTGLQLEYRKNEDPKYLRSIRSGGASDSKYFRLLMKSTGSEDIIPIHVFGDRLTDHETGEIIFPSAKPNELPAPIDSGGDEV
jgi:hypothetical protein